MSLPISTLAPLPTVPPWEPIVSPHVELALAVTFIVLYGLLFLFIYIQLFLILYYGHKRFSYQTVFLFLCLFWSALRTTLFSFYILNASEVNMLAFILYWLLLGFPVCLQFTSLCLLILYFAQVSLNYTFLTISFLLFLVGSIVDILAQFWVLSEHQYLKGKSSPKIYYFQ